MVYEYRLRNPAHFTFSFTFDIHASLSCVILYIRQARESKCFEYAGNRAIKNNRNNSDDVTSVSGNHYHYQSSLSGGRASGQY